MFKVLFIKEIKNIFNSPKFVSMFLISSLLILLSTYIGIAEYNSSNEKYNTAERLNLSQMEQSRSWMSMRNKILREPGVLEIFISGVNNDIGRYSDIGKFSNVKLTSSAYSEDPIFAFFRQLDFMFIVTVILSLLAILLTYDSINGEKESGLLRLIFSNSVPRSRFILAKLSGAWIGIILPITIPVLISILILLVLNINITSTDWIKLSLFLFFSLLYITFFISMGIFVSSLTKNSSTSFLILLVIWIITVFIIPRAGVMAAGQIIAVPTIAETESQIDAYGKARYEKHFSELSEIWNERNKKMEGMSESERNAYREQNEYKWFEEEDAKRKELEQEISEYSTRLKESIRNKKENLQKLAFSLSRFSPASAFQLASMNISQTNVNIKNDYERQLEKYRNDFVNYIDEKQSETGNKGMFRISVDSETGVKIDFDRNSSSLDISEVPKFQFMEKTLNSIIYDLIFDFTLLVLIIIAMIGLSYRSFLKYDLR